VLPRRRRPFAAAALLACLGALAACADDAPSSSSWRPAFAAWRHGDPIPDAPLVDQDGRGFALSSLDDGYVLIGFVFTRCAVPTACAATTAKMREVRAATGGVLDGKPLRMLSVTLDPTHDAPPILKAYADKNDAAWTFATGEVGLVDDVLPSLFNIVALKSGDTITHAVKVALLAPGRRPIAEWTDATFTTDDVVRAAH
jgi:protein SCO1